MHILQVPFATGGMQKTQGTEKAPQKIIEELQKGYCNEEGKESTYIIEEIKIDNKNGDHAHKQVYEALREKKEKCILIGGNHALTYSSFKALQNTEAGLLILDAHPDMEVTTETPTHEDFLRALIEEKILDSQKIVLIGIRNWSKNEVDFLQKNKIKYFTMQKIEELGFEEVVELAMEIACTWQATYLSIDIDVVDAATVPGTGYPEPGGISARELISAVQRIKRLKNLQRIDIVEVNPEKDVQDLTVKLAAKALKEML